MGWSSLSAGTSPGWNPPAHRMRHLFHHPHSAGQPSVPGLYLEPCKRLSSSLASLCRPGHAIAKCALLDVSTYSRTVASWLDTDWPDGPRRLVLTVVRAGNRIDSGANGASPNRWLPPATGSWRLLFPTLLKPCRRDRCVSTACAGQEPSACLNRTPCSDGDFTRRAASPSPASVR